MSSQSPGYSPTNMISASGGPSPNTVWVAFFHNGQARHEGLRGQAIKSVVPPAAGFANAHGLTNSAMAMKAMMTKAQLAMST